MAPPTRPRGRDPRTDRLTRDAHVNVLLAAGRFSDGMDRVCKAESITQAQWAHPSEL